MKKPQSLAGVIRQRLADIEARLEVGVRQEVIIDELASEGHQTSLQNFRNELWRARKWREKKLVAVQPKQTFPPQTPIQETPTAQQPSKPEKQSREIEPVAEEENNVSDRLRSVVNEQAREEKFAAYSKQKVNPLKKS